jgi:tRNA G10  N-methylase Trm11
VLTEKYIYIINYDKNEAPLAKLEIRSLLNQSVDSKIFSSPIGVNPSLSPFIKQRLEVIFCHTDMDQLILQVKSAQMNDEDFLIKYLEHHQEDLSFKDHRKVCKAIGMVMLGYPSFKDPKITFGLTYINDYWYFGILEENKGDWYLHKDKPRSYSSAINARIAKALVNIATKGDFNKRIIDPCCGVGTILIEALYSGYTITGMDINKKVVNDTLENLAYFNYTTEVSVGDIKDLDETYDVAIIDLPYNILSRFDETAQDKIIHHASRIAERMVFVSSSSIKDSLDRNKLKLVDYAEIKKIGKTKFKRCIWVCESL